MDVGTPAVLNVAFAGHGVHSRRARRDPYRVAVRFVFAGRDHRRSRRLSPVASTQQKHLALFLAREFASNLATPTLIADGRGSLVFYNEAAEAVVGRPFADVGEMPLEDWTAPFAPRPVEGDEEHWERPTQLAFEQRRAFHRRLRVTSADGVEREVGLTAFPLFAHADEFVGVVAIFWRE